MGVQPERGLLFLPLNRLPWGRAGALDPLGNFSFGQRRVASRPRKLQGSIRAGVETAGASKAIGLEGSPLINPIGRFRGTGPDAFAAFEATRFIDADPEETYILNEPAE